MTETVTVAPAAIPVYSAEGVDAAVDVTRSVARVVARHRYVLGPEVARFERDFAALCGTSECVAVANGTDALELALRALDVGAGSRVAVVANAGGYGSAALHAVGATPVYVDVDPGSLTMSADDLAAAAARGLDAVIVTHLYGRLAPALELIVDFARERGVPIIEDAAQAHGASRGGRVSGSFGTVGCFSFYPTKNLPAAGDAGAVVTDDAAVAERVRLLRQYGWAEKYHVVVGHGRNSRMDEVQAAVLNDRLPLLDEWNSQRRAIAGRYSAGLRELPGLGQQITAPANEDVAHLFVVRATDREAFRSAMAAAGVATDIHYPVPDHLQPPFAVHADRPLPVTEAACREVVTLPCYPGMSAADVDRVIDAARAALEAA